MYDGDPMSALVLVSVVCDVCVPVIFEIPKSSTLIEMLPSAAPMQKRLCGLRSR
jgi:hypothetical protein